MPMGYCLIRFYINYFYQLINLFIVPFTINKMNERLLTIENEMCICIMYIHSVKRSV